MSQFNFPAALAPYRNLIESLQLLGYGGTNRCPSFPVSLEDTTTQEGPGAPPSYMIHKFGCAPCFPVELAVTAIVALSSLKRVAHHVTEADLREQMLLDFTKALDAVVAEYCGTPAHPHWLGTQADIVTLVGRLAVTAEHFPDQGMRESLLGVAASIAEKAVRQESPVRNGVKS